jgi:ribosomal protein L16/L10AE
MRWICAAVLSCLFLASTSFAGEDKGPRREGEYSGVGGTPDPSEPKKGRRAPAKNTLTWVGFAADTGEVFLQAAQPFEITQRVEGSTLIVSTSALTRQVKNTRRPIDTRYFGTSVSRITAKVVRAQRARKGKAGHPAGVEVRIAFKNARDAREGATRTTTGEGDMFTVYVAVAPGEAVAEPPKAPAAPTESELD